MPMLGGDCAHLLKQRQKTFALHSLQQDNVSALHTFTLYLQGSNTVTLLQGRRKVFKGGEALKTTPLDHAQNPDTTYQQ